MLKKNIPAVYTLGIILFLVSCAKEGPTGPTGNPGPAYEGTISGYVSLYDKYGSKATTDLGQVSIVLSGSNVTTNPDAATGSYSFTSVYTGTYSISASTDSGYAATILYDVSFVSGTLYKDIKLSAIPDSFLTSCSAYYNTGSANDSLVITMQPDTRIRNCIVFASSVSTVNNAPSNYLLYYVVSIPPNATSVTLAVPGQDLTNVGFTAGSTVYFAAYSYVVNDGSVYEDPSTGNKVFNAVNFNAITTSAIVP